LGGGGDQLRGHTAHGLAKSKKRQAAVLDWLCVLLAQVLPI
jgi:hypothetical protein